MMERAGHRGSWAAEAQGLLRRGAGHMEADSQLPLPAHNLAPVEPASLYRVSSRGRCSGVAAGCCL